jgi:hypothetical protein
MELGHSLIFNVTNYFFIISNEILKNQDNHLDQLCTIPRINSIQ